MGTSPQGQLIYSQEESQQATTEEYFKDDVRRAL